MSRRARWSGEGWLHRAYHLVGGTASCMPGKGRSRGKQGGEGRGMGGGGEAGRRGVGGVGCSAWPWCRHANRPLLAPSARPPLSLITFSHSHTHKLMLLLLFLLLRTPSNVFLLRGSLLLSHRSLYYVSTKLFQLSKAAFCKHLLPPLPSYLLF